MNDNKTKIVDVQKILQECQKHIDKNELDEVLQKLKTASSVVNKTRLKADITSFNSKLMELTSNILNAAVQKASSSQVLIEPNEAQQVLPILKIAAFVYSQTEDTKKAADYEFRTGMALLRTDKFSEALAYFKRSAELHRKNGDFKNCAAAQANLGYLLFRMGRPEAREAYENAIQILKDFPDSSQLAEAEIGLGRVLNSLDQGIEAINHYKIAESVFEKMPKTASQQENIAHIKINIGNHLLEQNSYNEAIEYFEEAELKYILANNKSGVARSQLNKGLALIYKNLLEEAIMELTVSLIAFKELGYISETSLAYFRRGLAHYYKHEFEKALSDLEDSLELIETRRMRVKSPELRGSLTKEFSHVPFALSAVHLALYQKTGISEHIGEAFNTIELAKCDIVAEALTTSESVQARPSAIRKELIDEEDRLLNLSVLEQNKLLELAKLRTYKKTRVKDFRKEYLNLEKKFKQTTDNIRKLRLKIMLEAPDAGNMPIPRKYNVLNKTLQVFPREKNWAILEFAFLSTLGKLEVFLINKNGLILSYAHTVDLGDLMKLAFESMQVVERIRSGDTANARKILDSLSMRLYPALIPNFVGEILKQLNPEYLVIIPHSFLNWIPFEIIFDGTEYWGLKYAMNMSFSLDLTRICVEKRKKASQRGSPAALLVKNPLLDLGGADTEVDLVKNLFDKKGIKCSRQPIEHEKATQKVVAAAFNDDEFDILHYAGHALFLGKDPNLSHLVLHTSEDCIECDNKMGTLRHKSDCLSASELLHTVKFKRTPLVFLSACETGISQVEPGDEMFGLTRAFMYAGATSLILSHWLFSDVVGPIFAKAFYSELLEGETVAVALRNARRTISEKYNIIDWAILSLHGDPFRTLSSV